ncbi:NACHT domain-containing protein [Lentzea nigeriaca]|uniref:NACHT domain-containing protein n=1 Tax=Lentzea nigeriaca TaxID=1128665 RepID=UPI00195CDA72|nr:NACHT domain-containing protein [Lentzea nigeriaca]MBM7859349.1 hypothetical protein [Lentzea nigeriaca]
MIWLLHFAFGDLVMSAGVAAFGAAVAMGRELWKRWRERLIDGADRVLLRWTSQFGQRYREFMLATLRHIDQKGLATIGPFTPELDEVFVDVSLAYCPPHQVPEGVVNRVPADVADRRSIKDFLDQPRPQILAVLGGPGSGKTTLLRHTAREVSRARKSLRWRVPVLLYLRDHVNEIVADEDVSLADLIRGSLDKLKAKEPPGWFEQQLVEGDCVVLFDGLDEVARPEQRRNVSDWVERQTKQYPKNHFVLTSRPQGYRTAPISGATVLQVRAFTNGQVTRFVRGWYLATEKHSTRGTADEIAARAESSADDLLERLSTAAGLYELTVNPLLLTMICNVHRYRGALPGSRAELYGEICQVMLWRRQQAKKLPSEIDGDKKEMLLRGLAYTMMRRRVRDLPYGEIVKEITPALRRVSRDLTPQQFLADVGSNGLLVERENGQYSFAHLTFQEYLASGYIRDKGKVQELAAGVDDVWWRETTLLYAAKTDADLIVTTCLRSGSITALSLAVDCSDDQKCELAPELREQLDRLVESALTPDISPDRRRLLAGVLVTRHLRHQARTAAGGRVCTKPVTSGIHQLFLQDTGERSRTESIIDSPAPVTGVTAVDAVGFTTWVTAVVGGDAVYRLPKREELDDPIVSRALESGNLSAWLDPGPDGRSELWVPHGVPHPHLITGDVLIAHVTQDIGRSGSTLNRLLLLQAVDSMRALRGTLKEAPHRTFERDRKRDFDRAAELAGSVANACDRTHAIAHVLAKDLARELEFCSMMSDDMEQAGSMLARLSANVDHLTDLLDREVAVLHALDNPLGRDLDFARSLAYVLALNLPATPDHPTVMGRALSNALSAACATTTAHSHWLTGFSKALATEAAAVDLNHVVIPSELTNDIATAKQTMLALPAKNHSGRQWAQLVVRRLHDLAMPVCAAEDPCPTADQATAIRLAALCLAAEADDWADEHLGDLFRWIAAGVTLLERRAIGVAAPTETILLTVA